MKARRVLRGRLEDNEGRRIIVDDSNFNDGWRVTRFTVASDAVSSNEVSGKLALKEVPTIGWDWSSNVEIAWASSRGTVEANWGGFPNTIDPNNIIIQDLYVYGSSSNGGDINYLIEIERVTLSDESSVLALIQERAQDDL